MGFDLKKTWDKAYNWQKEQVKGQVEFIKDAGKSLDPWSGQSWQQRYENYGRVAAAIDTYGASEGIRAGVKELEKSLEGDMTGLTDVKPEDFGGVAGIQQKQAESRNWLSQMYTQAGTRAAPKAAAPDPIKRSGVQNVGVQFDPNAKQMALDAAQGLAPSAAQAMLTQGATQAGQLGMALAGARGGYNPSAIRGAQREMSGAIQNAAGQAATLRAQEMAQGRQEYNQLVMAEADNSLKAQMANQGVDLDVLKTNAARGDAISLANLESSLQTLGLNDQQQISYMSALLNVDESLITSELAKLGITMQRRTADTQSRTQVVAGTVGGIAQVLANKAGG